MWVLLMTIVVNGLVTIQPIEFYDTLQTCELERIRITVEMHKSYPIEEHNFTFQCVQAKKLQA